MKKYFREWRAYLRDNPEGYWFKEKLYGWGWTPARWEGWCVISLYIMLVLGIVFLREESIPGNPDSGSNVLTFALPIFVLTILLFIVAYKKGEKPHWRWVLSDRDRKA